MTAILRRGLNWPALLALCILVVLGSSCTSGGDDNNEGENPNGLRPSIFGLTKSSANPGETLSILGSNFGTTQGNGTVELGGIAFTVNTWSENQIDVTVPTGASSGIVVVERGNLSSQSGQEAQLFIGQVPNLSPVLYSITPPYGRIGQDVVSIVGTALGQPSANSGVFFKASPGSDDGTGVVQATVVTNPANNQPQWTSTNIRVLVPVGADTGDVYVKVGETLSNRLHFEALPPVGQLNDPVINDISTLSGPVGTEIILSGQNFGIAQGNSSITISSPNSAEAPKLLNIIEWTDTSIRATIPEGAKTGKIRITVGGRSFEFPTDFVVANVPVITGVEPSNLRIGQGVTIHGQFFGAEPGTLRIAGEAVEPSTWTNGEITVEALPPLSPQDVEEVPIVVTANGLDSAAFNVRLVSDLVGSVTVSPKTGIAGATNFAFTVSVAGGSGNYSFTLTPNTGNPGVTVPSNQPVINYIYPTGGSFSTSVKILDNVTGDSKTISGPDLVVGGPTDVIITAIETVDFGRGAELAENDFTRMFIGGTTFSYMDFSLIPQLGSPRGTFFTSELTDLAVDGQDVPAFKREVSRFVSGSPEARPFGYRDMNGGGRVRIRGYNFGNGTGEIWLNSTTAGTGTQVTQIGFWNKEADGTTTPGAGEEGYIEFTLPTTAQHLNGRLTIRTAGNVQATSTDPLVVSPMITVPPDNVPLSGPGATATIIGQDMAAPAIPGITGTQTHLFWIVRATYPDPFNNDTPTTNTVLCVHPFPVNVTTGNTINFDMNQLTTNADVEVFNGTDTQRTIIQNATLVPGEYNCFIWSGALPTDGSVPANIVAMSGVMSEVSAPITVVAGGPPPPGP
jgi:hypothetical protein